MLKTYRKHVESRAKQGIVPKPLDAKQVDALITLLKNPPHGEEEFILDLLENRVPPGVDEAAYVKAAFLSAIIKGEVSSPIISKSKAAKLLGTMQGGYNIQPLISLLEHNTLAPIAAKELSQTILIFDAFYDIEEKAKSGNKFAQKILHSWANAEWFLSKPKLQKKVTLTIFKVSGETNTDDLSPAQDAWSRPDIPLHALSMLKNSREGIKPDQEGVIGPIKQINLLKKKGYQLVYVGDVVGTGSSRKSATNSILWFMGNDIPNIPNKRSGGYVFAGKIAPIFFNTMKDSGALPIELDVNKLNMGDIIDIYPFEGKIYDHISNRLLTNFHLKTDTLIDEVRAGGRIPLIIGRSLTNKARQALRMKASEIFHYPVKSENIRKGYTLAQKIVGKACNVDGIYPGTYCEPKMTTVGSQDTTGPMTRDELKDLACLGFSSDLVMQSFCHTSAYPKPVDLETHHTLPDFIMNRAGVSLRPGDGVIHSWLNRMLLPDTVGTGGDSHTRFPLGISFPAGSGLVAFAAATGVMPLDMPESIRVRFQGEMQPGITLRDLVHSIPYYAIKEGLLTVTKTGKINQFSGRILEIEGLEHLSVEQAFELSDASAERSCAGCTIQLSRKSVQEYLHSNIVMIKWMISENYADRRTLERRAIAMQKWLDKPKLMTADNNAQYAYTIEINLSEIYEPILCVPNDPDDARLLSDVQGIKINEVFIGSCMTNIGHFRAAGKLLEKFNAQLNTRLWVAPPTKMDRDQLIEEGYYGIFGHSGARIETPGCSLCMGNQARVADNATVVSTSTRNFPNRLGKGANVYLASAELAAISAILGYIPTKKEYQKYMNQIDATASDTYRYLNFHRMRTYKNKSDKIIFQEKI
ncbi:bifunctional aconitate hydratase 2/2-methylisocitrate dehydratase [Candidatus Photodesmus anomalopis]|uniref:bifunctional aconitate hydratase 2/2-methylisocitrate dehydratase n=1 Tax=Candidatus Photodesmus anomalopis TaxID=28176 RepID=UPI00054FFFC8|nr:bifunctional aconitate hydratase 2/2-methylisocitrate dehydratase [Candidatus Photodesmus katoptron]